VRAAAMASCRLRWKLALYGLYLICSWYKSIDRVNQTSKSHSFLLVLQQQRKINQHGSGFVFSMRRRAADVEKVSVSPRRACGGESFAPLVFFHSLAIPSFTPSKARDLTCVIV
jgi:hypothetical protein